MNPTCSKDCPWPGLLSYTEQDADFFHGRSDELHRLSTGILNHRVTTVYGSSGTGKTSLLQAGVFPLVIEKGLLPVSLRSGELAGCASLCAYVKARLRAVCTARGYELDEERLPPLSSEAHETLWEYLQRIEIWSPSMALVEPLLLFDQFEEWLRAFAPDSPMSVALAEVVENYIPESIKPLQPSADWKKTIASRRQPWRIVLCLREDCLGTLDDFGHLIPSVTNLANRFALRRMTRGQAREAILGPGAGVVDEDTAERMLTFFASQSPMAAKTAAVGATFEPALISHVCRELNEKRLRDKAPRIVVEDMDLAAESVLRDFYEACFSQFKTDTARRFVEDALIDPSGNPHRTFATDAQALHAGIGREELEHLIDRRLLRRDSRLGGTHLELSHDVLIAPVRESRDTRRYIVRGQARMSQGLYTEAAVSYRAALRRDRTNVAAATGLVLNELFSGSGSNDLQDACDVIETGRYLFEDEREQAQEALALGLARMGQSEKAASNLFRESARQQGNAFDLHQSGPCPRRHATSCGGPRSVAAGSAGTSRRCGACAPCCQVSSGDRPER